MTLRAGEWPRGGGSPPPVAHGADTVLLTESIGQMRPGQARALAAALVRQADAVEDRHVDWPGSRDHPVWTREFWDECAAAELRVQGELMSLYDRSADGSTCDCDICVVRLVLEGIWPLLTAYIIQLTRGEE